MKRDLELGSCYSGETCRYILKLKSGAKMIETGQMRLLSLARIIHLLEVTNQSGTTNLVNDI
jgi:hypothetical protein